MTIHCTTVENLFKDSLKKVFRLILSKRRIVINNSYKQDKLFIEFFKKAGEKTKKVNTVEKSRKQEHFHQRGKQRANEVAAGKIQKIQRESFFNSTKSLSQGAKEAGRKIFC